VDAALSLRMQMVLQRFHLPKLFLNMLALR
jgi:hypothetical protein